MEFAFGAVFPGFSTCGVGLKVCSQGYLVIPIAKTRTLIVSYL